MKLNKLFEATIREANISRPSLPQNIYDEIEDTMEDYVNGVIDVEDAAGKIRWEYLDKYNDYDREINNVVDNYIDTHTFTPEQQAMWDEFNEFR